jgi:hypothetical protein
MDFASACQVVNADLARSTVAGLGSRYRVPGHGVGKVINVEVHRRRNMFKLNRWIIGSIGLLIGVSAYAQAPTLQQAQSECAGIAQQQTGYSPNAAPAAAPPRGGRARGAAAGAAAGAAKGAIKKNQYENVPDEVAEEYTKNQMEDGAKAGAVVGASRQRRDRRQERAAGNASADAYNQAYASCMTAKGFPGQ